MGLRGTCDNFLFGPTRNPFDVRKNAGGSSGGSAAAVADGLVPFAEGTDAGGSIRIPAAWCNLVGFKASFGRNPVVMRPNAFGGAMPFMGEGPISRTVVDKAVEAFAAAGATVERVKLGLKRSQREFSDAWGRLIAPLNITGLEGMKAAGIDLLGQHRDDFPPEYLYWIDVGRRLSAMDVVRDQAIRTEVFDAIQGALAAHEILVSPTLACMPVDNATDGNTKGPSHVNGEEVDPLIGWCLTYFTNFSGHPSISVPAGLSGGLPVGMQLIGRPYADADVLAAAATFERLQPWRDHYRICADRKF